jgi:phage-related protein
MNGLYSEASDKYKELNADVIVANEAQDRLNNAMASVGGAMEPFVTKGKELLAEVLDRLTPAIDWVASKGLPWVSEAISNTVNWFNNLTGKVSDTGLTFDSAMAWIKDAFQKMVNVLQEVWTLYGEPIWELIKQNVGLVADYFKERMPQIQEFVQTCFADIETIWNENLKPALQALGDFITNVLAPAFKWVFQNVITPVADAAFRNIGLLWSGTLKPVLTSMIDFISNVFSGNFSGAFQNVLDAVAAVWDGIKTVIKTPINAAIGLINTFIGSINGIKIPDWVPGMGGTGVLNIPTVPYLYKGGVLERGQVGILEGSGAEAVVPLENNKRWTRAVAQDMNSALGGANGQTAQLLRELVALQEQTLRILAAGQTIVLNEREVARTVRSYA